MRPPLRLQRWAACGSGGVMHRSEAVGGVLHAVHALLAGDLAMKGQAVLHACTLAATCSEVLRYWRRRRDFMVYAARGLSTQTYVLS